MNALDHSDIDGKLLQLLLAVAEERSVTRAAARLDVTQSAVSHQLDRLRAITGDALFVKSGRGIVATARAEALALHARRLLDELRAFAQGGSFDPAGLEGTVTIAANDLQRDLLLPLLLRSARVRACAEGRAAHRALGRAHARTAARWWLSAGDHAAPARGRRPGAEAAVRGPLSGVLRRQGALGAARSGCVSRHRAPAGAPRDTRAPGDRFIDERGIRRRVAVTVAGFSDVAPFLRGSDYLATLPGLLRASLLRGFATSAAPLPTPPMPMPMPMYMVWHQRHQADPMHLWLRDALLAIVAPALAAAELPPPRRS